jgi:hypothetical protein
VEECVEECVEHPLNKLVKNGVEKNVEEGNVEDDVEESVEEIIQESVEEINKEGVNASVGVNVNTCVVDCEKKDVEQAASSEREYVQPVLRHLRAAFDSGLKQEAVDGIRKNFQMAPPAVDTCQGESETIFEKLSVDVSLCTCLNELNKKQIVYGKQVDGQYAGLAHAVHTRPASAFLCLSDCKGVYVDDLVVECKENGGNALNSLIIRVDNCCQLVFSNCVFENGKVQCVDSEVTFINCFFLNANVSVVHGSAGAGLSTSNKSVKFQNCR